MCFSHSNDRGTIDATSLADRLLGRMTAYLRGEFIEDINDHATSEYVRLFKQVVINSRVSLVNKAKSVVLDAAGGLARKVCMDRAGSSVKPRLGPCNPAACRLP